MDWGYFTFRRWKRADLILFFLLTGAGFVALLLVPRVPQLAAMYPNQSHLSPDKKQALIHYYLLWDLSWLPGWEFLHRYFLLRAVAARWPRFGWLLVPLSEGVYHISKSPIEAIGMTAFSLVATQWSLRRRNILLPLLAHAAIELGLLVVLYG
jgi:membrane protease YdiL (CAAX protease family)